MLNELEIIDQVVADGIESSKSYRSGILCLINGADALRYVDPMFRKPCPDVGFLLSNDFANHLDQAIQLNPSIHDGAIICQRRAPGGKYFVEAWSMRLLPPKFSSVDFPNRGSAFNSALAMSVVPQVDAIYCWSNGEVWKFSSGTMTAIVSSLSRDAFG